MLIVYTLSHSQLSTLVVYKNAQLTRGDVFTASTNGIYTTDAWNGDLNSQNALEEVSGFDWLLDLL